MTINLPNILRQRLTHYRPAGRGLVRGLAPSQNKKLRNPTQTIYIT